MPWFTRPTLEPTPDGALLIHQVGPSRTEFIASLLWLPVGAFLFVMSGGVFIGGLLEQVFPAALPDKTALSLSLLGLAVGITAAGLLMIRRRQWGPRTSRLDEQGIEIPRLFKTPQRWAWQDMDRVYWWADRITLHIRNQEESAWFEAQDFAPGDWPIVRDWINAALQPRFDLSKDPATAPPFRAGLVILTALPAAPLIGVGVVLMPHLTLPQTVVASLLALGGVVQYLIVLACWGYRLSQPRLGNPYRPVRPRPPRLDPALSSERRPRGAKSLLTCAIPILERTADETLLIQKDQISVDDANGPIGAIFIAGFMSLLALVWAFEPQLDPRVQGLNIRAIVFFGILALAAVAWAVVACRQAIREFDRGTWRVEADRVSFQSHDGTTQSLRADEIERVVWDGWSARLRGQGVEIRLLPHGLARGDWQPVRDRLKAMLAPRFLLGPLPPPAHAARQFARAALLVVLVVLVAAPLALAVPPERLDAVLGGWWVFTVLANAALIHAVRRDRADWLWRWPHRP